MISISSGQDFLDRLAELRALNSRRREPASQWIHPEQNAMNRDAPLCGGGSTILSANRATELDGLLFAIRPQAAGPLPMPPAKMVNSIQTSFDNGRALSVICIATPCETAGQRAFASRITNVAGTHLPYG
jgi:hypothetical protein